MAKLVTNDLVSLANQTAAIANINANFTATEVAMEKTLSRDGTSPNAMEANLDMNSNRILNLPAASADTEPVRKLEFDELAELGDDLEAAVDAAEVSATAAAASAVAAGIAETNAEAAEVNAELAETNAEAAQAAAEAAAAQALLNSENPAVGYNFDTNTADSDPGAGDLKFNHATPASVTTIYIDNVDRDGNTQTGWLDSWDDSSTTSNKGTLVIRQANDGATFASYRVTGSIVDGTGYRKVTVTNLAAGSGSFDAGAILAVMFTHTGDVGVSTGDVIGPASATDNAVALFDSTTGKLIKNSVVIANAGAISGVTTLGVTTVNATTVNGTTIAGTTVRGTTIELGAADTDTTLSRISAGILGVEAVPVKLAGRETVWIPASAMILRTTNGAAPGTAEMATNKNMFKTLDFDATTQEFAQFEIAMPKSWNEGTVTFQPVLSHASGSGNVVFGLAAVARSDDDAGDVAFGTAQTSDKTVGTANDIYVGPESAAITIAGTPAEGDVVQFQINRTVASDNLGVDARLHGIKLYITTNAANDA